MNSFKIDGIQDSLEVCDDRIVISPKSVEAFKNKGLKGDFEIVYKNIEKIDFEFAGKYTNGYIHFITKEPNADLSFKKGLNEESIFIFKDNENYRMSYAKQIIEHRLKEKLNRVK